jgi:hypothetical protein
MTKWKGFERKQWWPNAAPDISFLGRIQKNMLNLSEDSR